MADDFSIEFDVKNLSKLLDGFKKVGEEAERTGKRVAGAGGPNAKGTGGGTPLQQARAAAQAQIFAARVSTAQEAQKAKADINSLRIEREKARTQRETLRLEKASKPKTPPSFAKRLTSFVRSARIGSDGNIMPLVGQGLDLAGEAGLGEAAGPLGLVATAALKAAEAVKKFADETSRSALDFNKNRLTGGGTAAETGILKTLSSIPGIGDLSAAAIAFRQNTSIEGGNPLAMGKAASMGLATLPERYGGTTDAAGNYISYLEKLRSIKDDKEAKRLADLVGDPNSLQVRSISAADWDALKRSGALTGNAMGGPGAIKAAAAYAASQALVGNSVDRLKTGAGIYAQNVGTDVGHQIDNGLSNKPIYQNLPGYPVNGERLGNKHDFTYTHPLMVPGHSLGMGASYASASPAAVAAYERYKNRGGMTGPEALRSAQVMSTEDAVRVAQSHTKALEKHTKALNEGAKGLVVPGNYGNTSRGDAVGEGMSGIALHRSLEKQGYQLGLF